MNSSSTCTRQASFGAGLPSSACGFALLLLLAGCDPVVSIAGTNFPDWLICVIASAAIALIARPLLLLAGCERYLRPLTIFYGSLTILIALVTWIIFFNWT